MSATYYQDFIRDNGLPVMVEYSFSQGSDTGYVEIVDVWPNTPAHDALCKRFNAVKWPGPQPWQRCLLAWLYFRIWLAERAARLTDAERERMEIWLIEHHEYEPYYPDWEDAQ